MGKSTDPASAVRDELLVVRCQLGEAQAFEELVRHWSGPLLRHVRRIAGAEAADDVAQDVWVRALRGITRLRDGAKLRPWLFGIAHHVVMDRFRLRHAQREALTGIIEDSADEAPDASGPLLDRLDDRLACLPVVERETLTLFYLEELSLLQIADIQAVPVGTVKSRLFRARAMLRRSMLEGKDDED